MSVKSQIYLCSVLLTLLLAFTNCSKKTPEPEIKYIPGEITVWTKDDTSIEKTFDFINEFGLPIERLTGILMYHSTLSNDSIDYVSDYLKAKPYTDNGKIFTTVYISGSGDPHIGVSPQLFNMHSLENQKDWLDTVTKLKLVLRTESILDSFTLRIRVPIGSEKSWLKKMEKHDIVELAYQSYE